MFRKVPLPFWILFIFFAYDDILRWFSTPFWLGFLIFIIGGIYFLYKNGKI
jgi:hypothetical protein